MGNTTLLTSSRSVGIVGYGAYIPRYRLPAKEVSRVWTGGAGGIPVQEKSVPGYDEDVVTMSIEAARNAVTRAGIDPELIRAVWVGSESHPYAVKPTSTIVAEALGIVPHTQAADWEFACKAGTEALIAAVGLVGSNMADYTLAIGMDTAQSRPGDALEYTAAAGGAAFVVGPGGDSVAIIESTYSFVTDTPDFWRRAYQQYPEHGQRFTGEPAYFKHITSAAERYLETTSTQAEDYEYAVFHQPNSKFPSRVAKTLGFTQEQVSPGMLVPSIGNTYSGAAIVGLTAILDIAKPGDRILMVSYGSGAGSDAVGIRVTEKITERKDLAPRTQQYVNRRTEIDYAAYTRMRGILVMK